MPDEPRVYRSTFNRHGLCQHCDSADMVVMVVETEERTDVYCLPCWEAQGQRGQRK